MNSASTDYSSVASLYDALGHLYSGGQISAAKASQVQHIAPGDKVLYAGVGGGEDACLAAKAGAHVTVVDLSQAMLDRAVKTFRKAGVDSRITVECGDIMKHEQAGEYDVVVANFFLNVFDESLMPVVMRHLAGQLRPGGTFMIADFRPLSDDRIDRGLQKLYFGAANAVFRLVANNPFHPIYDYDGYLKTIDFEAAEHRDFKLFGSGPAWYRTWRATKALA